MRILLWVLVLATTFSCGYKTATLNHSDICIKHVDIDYPEPTLVDTLNRVVADALIQSGKKLNCSLKKQYDVFIKVKSFGFYPIGYSPSQRASVYKVYIKLTLEIRNKEGVSFLKKDIYETTQYFGSGLKADIERRYALEEIGRLIKVRIYNILLTNRLT